MVAVVALAAVFLSLAATAVADDRVLERVSVGDGDFDARLQGLNHDGTRAFFETDEQLSLDDADDSQDVYLWTPGGVSSVSDTIGIDDEERDAVFKGASADGSRVFFETAASLTIDDTNNDTDVYSLSGIGTVTPELDRVSRGLNDGDGDGFFVSASADGARAYFMSTRQLTSDDDDALNDVFLRYNDGTGAETTLVTKGETSVNPSPPGATGINADGTHFFFDTRERLLPSDTDSSHDVYERVGTDIDLVSTGGNLDFDANFQGTSADGSRAFFITDEGLIGADDDAARDVYERSGGDTTLVSTDGANVPAGFAGASKDGTHVFFVTAEQLLTDADTDKPDIYERSGGMLTHVSSGPTSSAHTFGAELMDLSDDGSRVLFTTDERLVAADTDLVYDMYERTAGGIALVSQGEINGNGAVPAQGGRANADGTRIFFATAESLLPADTDSQLDLYERANGATDLVPGGNGAFGIEGFQVPAEGDRVFIQTAEPLLPTFDQDQRVDVYAARIGTSEAPPPNPTPVPPGSGEQPPGPDTLAPGVALSGRAVQRVVQQGAVVVFGRCDEACTLTATGTISVPGSSKVYRLRRARRAAPAAVSVRLKLRVPRKALSATRKALRRGRTVRARIRIVAVDAAGNRRTATRRIRARR